MPNTFIFFIILLLGPLKAFGINNTNHLHRFKTDMCTFYAEGTSQNPQAWAHCCVMHDFHYWLGGKKSRQKKSDLSLKECIKQTGHPWIAKLMFHGVRFGHLSPIKTPSRWAWGHKNRPQKDRFIPLVPKDILAAQKIILQQNPPLKAQFLEYLKTLEN